LWAGANSPGQDQPASPDKDRRRCRQAGGPFTPALSHANPHVPRSANPPIGQRSEPASCQFLGRNIRRSATTSRLACLMGAPCGVKFPRSCFHAAPRLWSFLMQCRCVLAEQFGCLKRLRHWTPSLFQSRQIWGCPGVPHLVLKRDDSIPIELAVPPSGAIDPVRTSAVKPRQAGWLGEEKTVSSNRPRASFDAISVSRRNGASICQTRGRARKRVFLKTRLMRGPTSWQCAPIHAVRPCDCHLSSAWHRVPCARTAAIGCAAIPERHKPFVPGPSERSGCGRISGQPAPHAEPLSTPFDHIGQAFGEMPGSTPSGVPPIFCCHPCGTRFHS